MIVEFSKPVFGFESSMVDVDGGSLKRQVHKMIIKLLISCITMNHVVATYVVKLGVHRTLMENM